MIVTEQSHAFSSCPALVLSFDLKGDSLLGYPFSLLILDLLLSLFSDCRSHALYGIWFRFHMAHFSAFGDSTASLLICVRIRFEPYNNYYLAVFVLPGPAVCFCGKMLCFYHGYLSFDPFFSIVLL